MPLPYRSFVLLIVLTICSVLVPGSVMAQTGAATDLSQQVDRFVQDELAKHNLPGLALAITHDDQVVYVQGYGVARAGEPITGDTQFFIASVSKSFTALAILQLVEAGKIDLDAPVQTYLPEFTLTDPAVAAQITVRQLLNQVSGLADMGFPVARLPQPHTLAERITSMQRARPVAAPGSKFIYYNPNYQILARVVEVTSGEDFSSYVESHILAPLEMQHSFSAITSDEAYARADNIASGHLLAYGIPVAMREMKGFFGGEGGIITTAADMAHYLIMQNNDGRYAGQAIVSPASLELTHTAPQGIDSDYAMGWFVHENDGQRVLEHNGVFSVFYTDIVLLPETRDGIVILYDANSLPANALAMPAIKAGLINLVRGQPATAGGFSLVWLGVILALCTLAGLALGIRALLRLPQWRRKLPTLPWWRRALGLLGAFAPGLFWLALPSIVTSTSQRAFSYAQLYRSMPGIMLWLSIGAVLGVINGVLRLGLIVRQRSAPHASTG